MSDSMKIHANFQNALVTYLNGAIFSRSDLIATIFSRTLPLRRHAWQIIRSNHNLHASFSPGAVELTISVSPYHGDNRSVRMMMADLKRNLEQDLAGAYVHGSLGTYEEMPYSDFDALVIIKDGVFEDKGRLVRVARKLCDAHSIMFNFDPLQHHGWFVLAEMQLKNYPDWYFPLEIFGHAKSLFVDQGLKLAIHVDNSGVTESEVFFSFCGKILRTIKRRQYSKNLYQLKSLLSQIMLLPSLYVQARDGKGVFKKYSFEAAAGDFLEEEWAIIEDISLIRQNWSFCLSSVKRRLFIEAHPLARYLIRHYAPRIPPQIGQLLPADFNKRLCRLIFAMQDKVSLRYK